MASFHSKVPPLAVELSAQAMLSFCRCESLHSVALLLCLISAVALAQQQPPTDLNVRLMRTTFRVVGMGKNPGEPTLGTAFVLLRPFSAQPKEVASAGQIAGRPVIVTAAHVLEEMSGEDALVILRTHSGDQWTAQPAHFKIRRGNQPLWTRLPDTDIAAMYVNWPFQDLDIVPMNSLPSDEELAKAQVEPGAKLSVLGYPLGAKSNDAGFPILRTGVIASYPLLPTARTKTFLLDFRVFKGNSGGPVYYSPSVPRGSFVICCPPQFIMGLVSQERSVDMPYSQLQLSLAVVIHASAIRATIESLPAPESAEPVNLELGMPQLALPH